MKAVDFVDEEHVVRLKAHQNSREITWFVEHRSGSDLETHTQLVGHYIGESGFSQTRRPVEKGVVESLAAQTGGLYEYSQVGDYLVLAGEVVKRQRAEGLLDIGVGRCVAGKA